MTCQGYNEQKWSFRMSWGARCSAVIWGGLREHPRGDRLGVSRGNAPLRLGALRKYILKANPEQGAQALGPAARRKGSIRSPRETWACRTELIQRLRCLFAVMQIAEVPGCYHWACANCVVRTATVRKDGTIMKCMWSQSGCEEKRESRVHKAMSSKAMANDAFRAPAQVATTLSGEH